MNREKIYLENIPMYEEYDLIDLNENDTIFLMKMYEKEHKNKISNGTRLPDGMFIIGRKKQKNNNSVSAEQFFKDYLKLGKDIFNLAISKKDIEIQYPYKLSDDYIYLKHIASDPEFEFKMREKYDYHLDEIYTIKEEVCVYLEDKAYEESLSDFQTLTDENLNIIYVLHIFFKQEVKDKLEKLINIMAKIFECCLQIDTKFSEDIFTKLCKINKELQIMLNDLEIEMKNKNLNIRKKTITSNARKLENITNIDFINLTNDYPIKIKFTYNQFKQLKKKWLFRVIY